MAGHSHPVGEFLAPDVPSLPTAPLLEQAVLDKDGYGTLPGLPFRHAFARYDAGIWRSPLDVARMLRGVYAGLLERAGLRPPAETGLTTQSGPYCLLVARTWMLAVPRSR